LQLILGVGIGFGNQVAALVLLFAWAGSDRLTVCSSCNI
jgi:hypothetical protein